MVLLFGIFGTSFVIALSAPAARRIERLVRIHGYSEIRCCPGCLSLGQQFAGWLGLLEHKGTHLVPATAPRYHIKIFTQDSRVDNTASLSS